MRRLEHCKIGQENRSIKQRKGNDIKILLDLVSFPFYFDKNSIKHFLFSIRFLSHILFWAVLLFLLQIKTVDVIITFMDYSVEKGKITVFDPQRFDIKKTLECGQVFRYKNSGESYEVIAGKERAIIKNSKNCAEISCTDENFFVKYFDLCRNYDIIDLKLRDKGLICAAIDFGRGIRILNQSPFETLISFIISANNHIPRIKSIIERLSATLGEEMDGYHAFPTAEALASRDEDFYLRQGLGYRAPYVAETARKIAQGFDLNAVYGMSSTEAAKYLMTLKGVGPKVADCILLFGYGKPDVFPVDTWIKKVYNSYFGAEDNPAKIRKALTERFGDLSGYAQQYLFYYKRELD